MSATFQTQPPKHSAPPADLIAESLVTTNPQAAIAIEDPSRSGTIARILTSAEQITPYRNAWRSLCHRTGGVIEQHEWVVNSFNQSANSRWCHILLREGELVAVAPLELRRKGLICRAAMTGVARYYEPMSFLSASADDRDELCQQIARSGLTLECGRLPVASGVVESVRRACSGRAILKIRPEASSPFIKLDDTWILPETHLNSGRRSDLRRARKRAEELGPVTFEIITPTPQQLPELLSEAFRVEQNSWKGTSQTALASDQQRGQFFREYAASACQEGTLRLCFMRIGSQAVAMQFAIEQSNRFWLLKVGYDADFSRCSPGMLLMRETIAYASRAKLESYEFLGTREPWTEIWTSDHHECVSLITYPYSLNGIANLMTDTIFAASTRIRKETQHFVSNRVVGKGRTGLSKLVQSLVKKAAGNYVAGQSLSDALTVQTRLNASSIPTTLGYWDGEGDTPEEVARQYLEALETMTPGSPDAYLSIKLPSLGEGTSLLDLVAQKALKRGCRLHFDALGPESVDRTQSTIDRLQEKYPGLIIGYTLPGRWQRSPADARWAGERRLEIRVVKGQWADPGCPDLDPSEGFLNVIRELAGRSRHVSLATHDRHLLSEATPILEAGGTSSNHEVLFGLVTPKQLLKATEDGQAPRVYLPYGTAYLPYAVSRLRKNPGIALRLMRDWCQALFRR